MRAPYVVSELASIAGAWQGWLGAPLDPYSDS